MHIGFDAKRAFHNNTGLGNYSRTLIRSVATFFPEHQYFLYAPTLPRSQKTEFFFQQELSLRKAPSFVPAALWRSRLVLPQLVKDRLDIFHGLSHELPIGLDKTTIRSVVTIHDLIFLRFPKLYPFIDRKIYRAKIQYACNHADVIIAISEQTKRDLIQFLDIPAEKIKVIYQSCSETFLEKHTSEDLQKLKKKYQLPEHFLLNVGTIEARKNLLLIAKSLKHLPDEMKCVVVGKKTAYYEEVRRFLQQEKLSERMIFIERIPFEELPVLYQAADVFLYPSRFEGFGIPVLEALCSQVPVIAATGSCLEEAGGEDSFYVHPDDEKTLAKAIMEIITSKTLQEKMKTKGLHFAENFTNQKMADNLMKVYKRLLR